MLTSRVINSVIFCQLFTIGPSSSGFAKKLDFVQKIGISAKKLDFSKKPGFQGHFSWISSWAPTGGWNCKKVGFQTSVKSSFFARNPYFLHEIQVFCKTRWQKTWISGCTQWAPTEIQVFCPWAAEIQDFCWNPTFLHEIQLFCKPDEEASGLEIVRYAGDELEDMDIALRD